MRQAKLISVFALVLLSALLILQNWEPATTHLLVWTVRPPLAALLLGALLTGYGLGLLTTALLKVRTWRSEALAARKLAAADKDQSIS